MKQMNKKKEQANQGEGKLIKVEIADASGHQTLMLTPQQTQEFVCSHSDMWVFVDNTFQTAENMSDVEWNSVETVRLLPGLVGGMIDIISCPKADQNC